MARTKQTARRSTAARSSLAKPSTLPSHSNKRTADPRGRKHQYPSKSDTKPTSPILCVHSPEGNLPRGRVLRTWALCVKPKTASNGGCRTGYMGYFVYHEGVLRRAIKCGAEVCDWDGGNDEAEQDKMGESNVEEMAMRGQEIQGEGGNAMEVDQETAPEGGESAQESSELEEGEIREDSSELEEGEIRE